MGIDLGGITPYNRNNFASKFEAFAYGFMSAYAFQQGYFMPLKFIPPQQFTYSLFPFRSQACYDYIPFSYSSYSYPAYYEPSYTKYSYDRYNFDNYREFSSYPTTNRYTYKPLFDCSSVTRNDKPVKPKSNDNTNPKDVNLRADTKYTGTAEDLNKGLGGVLSGKGDIFIKAQQQYGVNAAILASICRMESSNGKSKNAKEKNNVAGIRIAGSYEFRTFDSVDDCIMYTAKLLKNNYINKGLITLSQIGGKYCPIADKTDTTGENKYWAERVYGVYKSFA